MKYLAYIIILFSTITTLIIGFDTMSRPYSLSTIGFIIWAVSPYALLAMLVRLAQSKVANIGVLVLCIIACLFGLVLIFSAMYIHLDAQGGLIYGIM